MKNNYTIVTGATGGIGAALCDKLAASGYPLIIACRDTQRGEMLKEELQEKYLQSRIEVMYLDLSSGQQIHQFIEELKNKGLSIKGLVNNAAVLSISENKLLEGYDARITVNYLNTVLLTFLIIPLMCERSVIVNTVSCTRDMVKLKRGFLSTPGKIYKNRFKIYANTKKAITLFSCQLSTLLEQKELDIRVCCADPGVVNSGMLKMNNRIIDFLADKIFRPFTKSPKKGAKALYRALVREYNNIPYPVYYTDEIKSLDKQTVFHPLRSDLWDKTLSTLEDKGALQKEFIDHYFK